MKTITLLFAIFLLSQGMLLLVSCSAQGGNSCCRLIYDFEDEKDLQGLGWRCHTWYQRSRQHVTHGRFSLEVQMYPPETYPGFFMADLKGSWKGTRTIRLDIFNPAKRPLPVTFRIDDVINPPYEDRINERILLKNGMNYVVLDFSRLTTSGTGRHLDTAHVCAFMFFIASPSRPVTIFIDNIRLCK